MKKYRDFMVNHLGCLFSKKTLEPDRYRAVGKASMDSRAPISSSKKTVLFHTFWLMVYLYNPLKNMSSSVGMIIPNIWKNKVQVPNHQPAFNFDLTLS